ncbi:MAG: holo-ACP synthase [Clostridia bacterium]|nr:holo-ACP synthase [Clostridia bacterium]
MRHKLNISCGTDIIEISRIKKTIERLDEKFLDTIFTKNEIEYCESHKDNKYQHYAARFAAKEAVYKALNNVVDNDKMSWKNFEIINDTSGKPKINFQDDKIDKIDISISHCKEYAVANVVVLYE